METKKCNKCLIEKSISSFYKHSGTKDGYFNRCKKCYLSQCKTRREKPKTIPDEKKCLKCGEIKKSNYFHKTVGSPDGLLARCKECANARKRELLYEEPYEKRKNRKLYENYRITLEEHNEILKQQNGRCPICLQLLINTNIDHDHETGMIRGILCHHCNTAIGLFKDNVEYIRNAIEYLKERDINNE